MSRLEGKRQEESSFFEKKEAKKLFPLVSPPNRIDGSQDGEAVKPMAAKNQRHPQSPNQTDKSFFASFFTKKEDSSFLPLASS